jgi:cyclopropane-fatty-acyl-phospholipid synthase
MNVDKWLESGLIPEPLIRMGIRKLLANKLKTERRPTPEAQQDALMAFIAELKNSPIAIQTEQANEQHYELPAGFFHKVLGKHVKYSSGFWTDGTQTLDQAEENMLKLTCTRAGLEDGQTILELGCGWGSLSLWMAEHYPRARIMAVSNSHNQRRYIEARIKERSLTNLQIITANITQFETERRFDRVVSVEMFEHMKNYERLLEKVSQWLTPQGKLFVHIFTHKEFAYHYEGKEAQDWITRYFFAGGTMPSNHLLAYFQKDVKLKQHWVVDGTHYQKTAEAWLKNMREYKTMLWPLFQETYGTGNTTQWWAYWEVFFMSCAELWGYKNGSEWMVSHYLFENGSKYKAPSNNDLSKIQTLPQVQPDTRQKLESLLSLST